MAASLLNPLTCGFVKVAAWEAIMKSPKLKRDDKEGSAKYKARGLQGQYQEFKDLFADRGQEFTLDQLEFNKRTLKLEETMKTWSKDKPKEKQLYLETFSSEKWKKLSNAKKAATYIVKMQRLPSSLPKITIFLSSKICHNERLCQRKPLLSSQTVASTIKNHT